jgi:hypothetical protein
VGFETELLWGFENKEQLKFRETTSHCVGEMGMKGDHGAVVNSPTTSLQSKFQCLRITAETEHQTWGGYSAPAPGVANQQQVYAARHSYE